MTLAEVQSSLTMWRAAYDASVKGQTYTWNGRTVTPQPPDVCMRQIQLLERKERMLKSGRTGHNVSQASFY